MPGFFLAVILAVHPDDVITFPNERMASYWENSLQKAISDLKDRKEAESLGRAHDAWYYLHVAWVWNDTERLYNFPERARKHAALETWRALHRLRNVIGPANYRARVIPIPDITIKKTKPKPLDDAENLKR